ncbi:UDP-N-acetylmuramate dehydrogenase [uncultured Sanguibacteroides sp.]|uniref:UDP-N-acetylmuramate dehydrogenase n=1 Tax=uncultured Sanguibacteroides sp. TaxID=1635151 RepID=UPI0025D2B179|nr:UDP-N-acetylmuramate dehydrogenase [uncultured Sanguibacteroides sp.]
MRVRENYNLKAHNTFGMNAACKYFVESDQEKELLEFITDYELDPEEIIILGGGSNFLFTTDFSGVVFYPLMEGYTVLQEDEHEVSVQVGSGVVWDDFVAWAVEHEYYGIENLSLIPGHVGATPVQNIGAYGVEVKEVISGVQAIDLQAGEVVRFHADQCRFGYRDSIFKHEWKNRFIITYVIFRFSKQPHFNLNYGSIREEVERLGELSLANVRQAVIRIRNTKLPDVKVWPNAGSFFKNPMVLKEQADTLLERYPQLPLYPVDEERVKVAAGWLIEAAGWKGKGIGNAGVHDKQALVLINKGGANGVEVAHLANEIKKSVFLKFGIWLEPEVNII